MGTTNLVLLVMVCFLEFLLAHPLRPMSSAGFAIVPKTPKLRKFCKMSNESSGIGFQHDDGIPSRKKRIVFIRHGCTHMNEYLATPGCRWGDPHFSDVFNDDILSKYKDSSLSAKGVRQAQNLSNQLEKLVNGHPDAHEELSLSHNDKHVVNELDLVVVSPLTRALKTLEIALWPHMQTVSKGSSRPQVPIVAHPFAAERVYLISDIGKPVSELEKEFGHFVDFEVGFEHIGDKDGEWWFSLEPSKGSSTGAKQGSFLERDEYVEWRPIDQAQNYACAGEPDFHFEKRMIDLYSWLEERPEATIALVCHWGVIDWMLGEEFDNCEIRVVPFDDIQPKKLTVTK